LLFVTTAGATATVVPGLPGRLGAVTARTRLIVSFAAGVVGAVASALAGAGKAAPLIGWDVVAAVFCTWVWLSVVPQDAPQTSAHAVRENPSRTLADLVLLVAAVASLIAVAVVLVEAGNAKGSAKLWELGLGVVSVAASWTLVHTVFTLKYARLYYTGTGGGISFNEDDPPRYTDFAYLAFTVGMTFQVSDTDVSDKDIRRTILRHMLLSYVFGAVIIAVTINLVAGLTK